jgi:nucleoid DNA-binding protein
LTIFDTQKKQVMDISIYLVELLRLHDCVIIPDLGGFVTNYRPAEMDLASNSFNPPVKDVIFTGKLSKNDGLLVNYISEIEGTGYMEARQIISEFVDEMWSKLENGEIIKFQNIGTLQFDRSEKLIFEPEIHENFLLDVYGMESFQFPQLEHKGAISNRRVFSDKEPVRPVFNSRKVKVLVGGLTVLLALIIIPVSEYSFKKRSNTNFQTSRTAAIPTNGLIISSNPVKADSDSILKSPKVIAESFSTQRAVNQSQTELISPKSGSRYRVIGGCFKLNQNAENFVAKLKSGGFKPELKVLPNGSFLVIVQSYTDRNEAYIALNTLREAEPKTGYWMSVK